MLLDYVNEQTFIEFFNKNANKKHGTAARDRVIFVCVMIIFLSIGFQ